MPYRQIAGTLIGLAVLLWESADETAHCKRYKKRRRKRPKEAPAKKYEHAEHSTEEEHRTAEQHQWRTSIIVGQLTTIFAAVAVGLTYCTLQATREQVQAAKQANSINQNVLAASVSSSVYFEDTFHIKDFVEVDGAMRSAILFGIGNSGASTTRHLTYQTTCRFSDRPIADPFDIRALLPRPVHHLSLPPKGDPLRPIACTTDLSALNHLQLTNGWLYVFGLASYDDTVDETRSHRVEFCLQTHGVILSPAGWHTTQDECPRHNCTDNECSE